MNLLLRFLLMIFINVLIIYILFKLIDFLDNRTKHISDKNRERFSKTEPKKIIYKSNFSTLVLYSIGLLFYFSLFVMNKKDLIMYKPLNTVIFILILGLIFIMLDLIILKGAFLYRFDNLKTHLCMSLIYGLVIVFFLSIGSIKYIEENPMFRNIVYFQKYIFGIVFGVFVLVSIWIIFSIAIQYTKNKKKMMK